MARVASLKPYKSKTSPNCPWCVDVPPHLSDSGKRKRLFFETERLAKGECEKLKTRKDNFGISLVSLTPARIAVAAEAYKLLEPHRIDLLDAVRSHLQSLSQRQGSISFGGAFDQFLELKQKKSPKYQSEIKQARDKFKPLLDRLICDIKPDELEEILAKLPPASRNAKMRRLRSVFNLAIKRGWIGPGTSPIARMDFEEIQSKEVETHANTEVKAMLEHALEHDPELLPFLVLGFFCGLRPDGELQKLEWRDLKFDGRHPQIVIRPEVSKTKRRRFVDISRNAVRWLNLYRRMGGSTVGKIVPFSPNVLRKKRRRNRTGAKVARSIQQGMRHTYCSNWLALHEDVNKLVLQSGHDSAETMWKHYHRGTTKAEAKKFWSIQPPKGARENIVPFKQVA
jgi:integrase